MGLHANCFWCTSPHAAEHALSVCPTCMDAYRARRFPLGPLGMSGSFSLDDAMIDEEVSRTSAGNYALGYMDDGHFLVFYVGRSDSDVRLRLHEWVGASSEPGRYGTSAQAPWGMQRRHGSPGDAPALARVAAAVDSSYTRFAYSYAASAEAAFEKECRNYDDFGGLDNAARPVATPA